jgi:hypothetical protein
MGVQKDTELLILGKKGGTMRELLEMTGMVIRSTPVGEYDKRLVLLTRERGKITAFARGAKRPGNSLMGPSRPFAFGQFRLIEGRDSYSLQSADISQYFEELAYRRSMLRTVFPGICRLLFQGEFRRFRHAPFGLSVPAGSFKPAHPQQAGTVYI